MGPLGLLQGLEFRRMEKNIKNETVTGGISHRYIRDIEGDLRITAPVKPKHPKHQTRNGKGRRNYEIPKP